MRKNIIPAIFLKVVVTLAGAAGVQDILHAQKQVAITIDDIPNTVMCDDAECRSVMLETLDQLNIPVAIFINEGKCYQTGYPDTSVLRLLDAWIGRKYITAGNHSFSHKRYSELGPDSFAADIERGGIMKKMAAQHGKKVRYFRFPFNDLGKDSVQHVQITSYLSSLQYQVAPFTIESSDWAYNDIYSYWLRKKEYEKAAATAGEYMAKTLDYFAYFERISLELYGRPVKHIYLCHDNALNARYLPELIRKLRRKGYSFISLEEALSDEIYRQEDRYYRKFGVSWLYRWMFDKQQALKYMKAEPDLDAVEGLRDSLMTLSRDQG